MAKMSKPERGWVFYDWANSAYSIIVVTAIFPLYYKAAATEAGIAASTSTAYLGYANSIATLIVSLLAPILGTIADFKGFKKKFFIFFTALGVLFTIVLGLIPSDQWIILLACFVLTSVGFAGANIFYDAFLVDVTSVNRMNRISANGYALGYIGSCIPFVIAIAIIIMAQQEIISLSVAVASQLGFAITGLWWGLFTIPMLKHVDQKYYVERVPNPISTSFKRLFATLKNIKAYRAVFLFLIAYFFYIDGVHTIIKMATAYGSDLGVGATTLLIILFVTQIVAAPAAYLFGKLGEKFTEKRMIMAGIIVYTFICIYSYFMNSALDFWILAMVVGCVQGGIQALSRSYFAKLIPKESSNEFFGFYNVFGKFAAIAGPLLVGVTAQMTGNTNSGVFSLVILFIIGGILLMRVPNQSTISFEHSVTNKVD
ncbi:MFS transporter [Bacillus sp. Bva_UNVM-123]|uniref:MFS transporter n=1 Tax=Bacillus sp. Bva_UNVM-123 TaxID=2829798 RepID=UPI00391F6A75